MAIRHQHVLTSADTSFLSQASIPTMLFLRIVTAFSNTSKALAWNRCLSAQLQLPPAAGNGWKLTDGQLELVWMTRPSAPESILEHVSCKCQTRCKTKRCSCLKSDLRCTDLCGCKECNNGQDEEHNLEETDELFSCFDECDPDNDGDILDDEC